MSSNLRPAHVFLFGFLFLLSTIVVLFVWFDYRQAKLQFVGEAIINPPLEKHYTKGAFYFIPASGKEMPGLVNDCLFMASNQCMKSMGAPVNEYKPKYPDWTVDWIDDYHFQPEKFYLICFECKIEYISYFYHSKYFDDPYNDDVFTIHGYSLVPMPSSSTLYIYEIDIPLYKRPTLVR